MQKVDLEKYPTQSPNGILEVFRTSKFADQRVLCWSNCQSANFDPPKGINVWSVSQLKPAHPVEKLVASVRKRDSWIWFLFFEFWLYGFKGESPGKGTDHQKQNYLNEITSRSTNFIWFRNVDRQSLWFSIMLLCNPTRVSWFWPHRNTIWLVCLWYFFESMRTGPNRQGNTKAWHCGKIKKNWFFFPVIKVAFMLLS